MLCSQVLALAGLPLNMADPIADIRRIAYLNQAVQTAIRLRPDLMMGRSAAPVASTLVETDPFPIDAMLAQPVADYVASRSSLWDAKPADLTVIQANIERALQRALTGR